MCPTLDRHPIDLDGLGAIAGQRWAADGTWEIVLMPDLDTLLGAPGFEAANRDTAIRLPGTPRPMDGWALFGPPAPVH